MEFDWEEHFKNPKPENPDIGAMERGVPIPNTNGAVIPPGRYWLDVFANTQAAMNTWLSQKPEVRVETTEDKGDGHVFYIFSIPADAGNFGKPGVWFPTVQLGFPTIAPSSVTTSDDTVQKPDAPTSTDVAKDFFKSVGEITGAGTSSLLDNVSTGTLVKLALVGGAIILIATLPSTIIPMLVSAKAALGGRKS